MANEEHGGAQYYKSGLPDFQTKKPNNLGKFWMPLEVKRLIYSMAIWNICLPFGMCHGHLVI
jgi:hypothetical protein